MKTKLTLLVVVMILVSGCCTHRNENTQNDLQAYGEYMADIQVTMANLRILDAGDVSKTRLHALAHVSLALHGLTCLDIPKEPWQQDQEKKVAQDVLAYMVVHWQDINPNPPPLLRDGIRALAQILTNEDEKRQLKELSNLLEKKP